MTTPVTSANDPRSILDLLDGFRRTKTLCAAVRLGIFDGRRPPGRAVNRLLDACVALGLLNRCDGVYVNTALADEYLRESGPQSLAPYIRYSDCVLYPLWADLDTVVVEGVPRPRPSPLMADDVRRDFVRGMHGTGLLSSRGVIAAFDLSRFRRVVDLGGATGHLAVEARRAYPHMQVVVFDVPTILEMARPLLAEGVNVVAGDFNYDPLPVGDLYMLGRVIHNLADERARALLARVYDALAPDGAVLLAEQVIEEGETASVTSHMQTLNMLVCTGGEERSVAAYETLLAAVGFHDVRARQTGTPLDAILGAR